MSNAGIHGTFTTYCMSVVVRSKSMKSQIAMRSGGTVKASAAERISPCAFDGKQRITNIPRIGMKIISVSTHCSIDYPLTFTSSPDLHDEDHHHGDDDPVEVGVDATRLHVAESVSPGHRHVGEPVHGAVDPVEIEKADDGRPDAREARGAVDDAVDDVLVEGGAGLGETERAVDDGRAV